MAMSGQSGTGDHGSSGSVSEMSPAPSTSPSVPSPHTSESSAASGGSSNYSVGRNSKTTFYEIHKEACAHMISKHIDFRCVVQAENAKAAAAAFEASNEGCWTKLGPCVKKEG